MTIKNLSCDFSGIQQDKYTSVVFLLMLLVLSDKIIAMTVYHLPEVRFVHAVGDGCQYIDKYVCLQDKRKNKLESCRDIPDTLIFFAADDVKGSVEKELSCPQKCSFSVRILLVRREPDSSKVILNFIKPLSGHPICLEPDDEAKTYNAGNLIQCDIHERALQDLLELNDDYQLYNLSHYTLAVEFETKNEYCAVAWNEKDGNPQHLSMMDFSSRGGRGFYLLGWSGESLYMRGYEDLQCVSSTLRGFLASTNVRRPEELLQPLSLEEGGCCSSTPDTESVRPRGDRKAIINYDVPTGRYKAKSTSLPVPVLQAASVCPGQVSGNSSGYHGSPIGGVSLTNSISSFASASTSPSQSRSDSGTGIFSGSRSFECPPAAISPNNVTQALFSKPCIKAEKTSVSSVRHLIRNYLVVYLGRYTRTQKGGFDSALAGVSKMIAKTIMSRGTIPERYPESVLLQVTKLLDFNCFIHVAAMRALNKTASFAHVIVGNKYSVDPTEDYKQDARYFLKRLHSNLDVYKKINEEYKGERQKRFCYRVRILLGYGDTESTQSYSESVVSEDDENVVTMYKKVWAYMYDLLPWFYMDHFTSYMADFAKEEPNKAERDLCYLYRYEDKASQALYRVDTTSIAAYKMIDVLTNLSQTLFSEPPLWLHQAVWLLMYPHVSCLADYTGIRGIALHPDSLKIMNRIARSSCETIMVCKQEALESDSCYPDVAWVKNYVEQISILHEAYLSYAKVNSYCPVDAKKTTQLSQLIDKYQHWKPKMKKGVPSLKEGKWVELRKELRDMSLIAHEEAPLYLIGKLLRQGTLWLLSMMRCDGLFTEGIEKSKTIQFIPLNHDPCPCFCSGLLHYTMGEF